MKRNMILSTLVILNLCSAKAVDSNMPKVATTCLACHGEKGISANDLWPNLAGQKKDYITKQLNSFQSGERKDPMMSPMAASLSKEDIQSLAKYFSAL